MSSYFSACLWRLEAESGGVLWRGELQVSRGNQNARGKQIVESFICTSGEAELGGMDRQTEAASAEPAVS